MPSWRFVEYQSLSSSERSAFSMGPFGSKITKENYVSAGVPVVRGVNLARGIFVDDDFVFIEPRKADELLSANVEPGDLIFTHRGTIGQVSMIPRKPRFDRYVIGSSQVKTRLDESVALPEFYYYWFMSPEGQRSILANTSTVGVPGIATPLTSIRGLRVPLPPLPTQRDIAAVLNALDDKISNNDRIARTSREVGMVLYASALSKPSREQSIGEITTLITRGQAPKYIEDPAGVAILNQKCIRDGRVLLEQARLTEAGRVKEDRILQKYDVLVNSTGVGTLGRVGIWSHDLVATVDSHVTILRIDSALPAIVGGFAILWAQPEIEDLGEGSTGQTELSRTNLASVKLQIPEHGIPELADRLAALEDRARCALEESKSLATLRDALLTDLMSETFRVRDVEKIVEEVI